MWTWDIDTQEILGFQDIKGRGILCDVSEDGRYCGWRLSYRCRYDSQLGVSRPYSFHSLFWRKTEVLYGTSPTIHFQRNKIRVYSLPPSSPLDNVEDRVSPGCPFEILEMGELRAMFLRSRRVARRGSCLIDRCGRRVELTESTLLSGGSPLIDLARPKFT